MKNMRKVFDFGNKKSLGHWFPRHMGKGMRQMRGVLRKVDCVIEVHDARIPLCGRNPDLREALLSKPSLVVFNKMDLANLSAEDLDYIHGKFENEGILDYTFAKCSSGKDGSLDKTVQEIIPRCKDIIDRSTRYDREGEVAMELLVVGIPNVGKSSLVNALRRQYLGLGKGVSTGKLPGHTRSLMNKVKVCNDPLMYLHDTPGILEPRITDLHCGMKLALCGAVLDHLIGSAMIADYLLFALNQKKQFAYVDRYHLKEPMDEIQPILHNIALTLKQFQVRNVFTGTGKQMVTVPNYENAARAMLQDFRCGYLGQFVLDNTTTEHMDKGELIDGFNECFK